MTAPAIQIREAITAHLRSRAQQFTLPVTPDQIRGTLDLSGTPRGFYGIVIAAEDLGDHAGNTGRVLVDIRPSITVFSHLEEDLDGQTCDTLTTDILNLMQSITYTLNGWQVAWRGNWTITDTAINDSFRQNILTATIPIVKQ
ncbi:MAG: hypothetical protein J5746_12215 [Victivallales bacterium]|nr:hypothetical protein [Victivallales bacterium]